MEGRAITLHPSFSVTKIGSPQTDHKAYIYLSVFTPFVHTHTQHTHTLIPLLAADGKGQSCDSLYKFNNLFASSYFFYFCFILLSS